MCGAKGRPLTFRRCIRSTSIIPVPIPVSRRASIADGERPIDITKGVMNAVLDYPTWFELVPAFVSPEGDFDALKTIVQQTQRAYTSGAFMTGSFLENHDHPRFGSLTSDPAVRETLNPSPVYRLKCRI